MNGPGDAVRRETWVAGALCLVAGMRVFAFCGAFPFFANVDEQAHFDLVYKYSRGHIPGGLEHWAPGSARLIALYDSPEYNDRPDEYPGGVLPRPHWPLAEKDRGAYEAQVSSWVETVNHESMQPPVYYAVAGVWYRIGEAIGLSGGPALYWARFLNVLACGLLTWLAYVFGCVCFPDRPFVRLGLPFLVAFVPQDAFYSLNNDVFLPLVNGAAFLCLVLIVRDARKAWAFHAGTGLLVAAAVLVKFSSIAIVPVAVAMLALRVVRQRDGQARRRAIAETAVALAAAAIPIGVWCARNVSVLGDVTGSMEKARFLGWAVKPLGSMLDHPIFTPAGMAVFWRETLATFWRGEFVWAQRRLASPGWDLFYGISSFVMVAAALVAPFTWRRDIVARRRSALWPSFALFALSLAFLATISVVYDFGDCPYPSRAMPYMSSGRLALGALIPFSALYLCGWDAVLPRRLPEPVRWLTLIVPVLGFTASEIGMSRAVFESAYNWFHMI